LKVLQAFSSGISDDRTNQAGKQANPGFQSAAAGGRAMHALPPTMFQWRASGAFSRL
jgi:hypothetical protein